MVTPQVADLIAADRMAERQRSACTAGLARLARCCRPSIWTRAARRAAPAIAQFRSVVDRGNRDTAPCCTPA